MKVIKADLIRAVQKRLDLPHEKATRIVNTVLDAITKALAAGEEVRIHGFGKFFVRAREYTLSKTDRAIGRGRHQRVRFNAFGKLKEKVACICIEDLEQLSRYMPVDDRRQKPRADLPEIGAAIVRISGIPVCEFKIKDISEDGSALLVEQDSVMLRNIRIGQEIDIRINHGESLEGPVMQRSKIIHITKAQTLEMQGYYILGVRILGRLPI